MIVSYSEVYTYFTCRRRFYYHTGLGLVSNAPSPVHRGVFGHKVLEIFYKELAKGKTREEAAKKALDYIPEFQSADIIATWALLKQYFNTVNLDGIVIAAEEPMYLEIDENLTIAFTPDLAWKYYNSNRIDFEDSKFIARKWNNNKTDRFMQLLVYIALARRMGYSVSRGYLRFFNIRTDEITHKLFDPSDKELEIVYNEFIKQAREVAEFKSKSIDEMERDAVRTPNYLVCDRCDYLFPCKLQQSGKDASATLETQYSKNERGSEKILKEKGIIDDD